MLLAFQPRGRNAAFLFGQGLGLPRLSINPLRGVLFCVGTAPETPLLWLPFGGNGGLDKDSERFVCQEHDLEPRLVV